MEKELTINGMHCNACVNLIKMELAEVGLEENVKEVKLFEGQTKGLVSLTNVTDEQVAKAVKAIDALDSYSVEN